MGGEDTPCLPDTNPKHQGLMGAYGQGQTDQDDLSYIVDHHRVHADARNKDKIVPHNQSPISTHYEYHTDASDLGLMGAYGQGQTDQYDLSHANAWNQDQMAAWNQYQMGAFNLNPIGTHRRGQTGAHDPNFVSTYGQGQIDTYHQSEIDSHKPSYMSPQYTGDVDDLTEMVKFSKPIRTRGNQ